MPAAYFLLLETPVLSIFYTLIPPFLFGELCCLEKGTSFLFHNSFRAAKGHCPYIGEATDSPKPYREGL